MKPNFDLSLYLVTDRPFAGENDIEWIVEQAVMGGATIVQLREKNCSTAKFIEIAKQLKEKLSAHKIPLIINDRIDVALAVDAEGVHIGQSDMPYELARKLLGPDKIIGLSVENMQDVIDANNLDVDYIGISPVFATPTKTDTSMPFGLDGTQKAVALSKHRTVAIGGMNKTTIGDVVRCGVEGVAVVSAIVSATSPREAAKELSNIILANRLSFTQTAWICSMNIVSDICQHPFNLQLKESILDKNIFIQYLIQDKYYLQNFTQILREIVTQISDEKIKSMFLTLISDNEKLELSLNSKYLKNIDINNADVNPIIEQYIEHEKFEIAKGNFINSLVTILPCFWIFNEIGKDINTDSLPQNQYGDWLLTYSSKEMTDIVDTLKCICDEQLDNINASEKAVLINTFRKSIKYELDILNSIYNGK